MTQAVAQTEIHAWTTLFVGLPNLGYPLEADVEYGLPCDRLGEPVFFMWTWAQKPTTMPEVEADGRDWVSQTIEQLEDVARLPDDWDSEGSSGTNPAIARTALELLGRLREADELDVPVPTVCPVAGGGFQIEWAAENKSLELEFIDANTVTYLQEEQVAGERPVVDAGEYPARRLGKTLERLKWFLADQD